MQDWWVSKISRHRAQMFSYKYVIQPAANYTRTFGFHTFKILIRHLLRAYRYWFYRCKDMTCRDLWLPSPPDNNATVLHRAVKHCLYCLPTQVLLHKNRVPVKVHPCNQYRICPFCASRFAEDVYRRFMRARETLLDSAPNALVTYRVESFYIPAQHFDANGWTRMTALAQTKKLAGTLRRERAKYLKLAKDLRSVTLGSLWQLVVFPKNCGWTVEIRQLYITTPKSPRPAHRRRKSGALRFQSVKLREYRLALELLGEFVKYPGELLTGYAELTAAALNARRGVRLFNGTGQLYRKGRKKTSRPETAIAPNIP